MAPPTRTQLEKDIRAWIVIASELADTKVIFAGQNAPLPAEPFITVQIIANPSRGWPIRRVYNEPGETDADKFLASVEIKREPRADVNIWGADHRIIAERIERARWFPAGADALAALGLGLSSVGELQDLSRLPPAGDPEYRTLIQMTFYGSDLATYDADVIETTTTTHDPPLT